MLIVVLEKVDGKLVQSPANRKTYKTWDGAMSNLLGFGADPPKTVVSRSDLEIRNGKTFHKPTEIRSGEKVRVVTCHKRTFFLVDVLAEAVDLATTVELLGVQLSPT